MGIIEKLQQVGITAFNGTAAINMLVEALANTDTSNYITIKESDLTALLEKLEAQGTAPAADPVAVNSAPDTTTTLSQEQVVAALTEAGTQLQEAINANESLSATLSSTETKLAQVQEDLLSLQASIAQKDADLQAAQAKIAELTAQADEKQKQIATMEADYNEVFAIADKAGLLTGKLNANAATAQEQKTQAATNATAIEDYNGEKTGAGYQAFLRLKALTNTAKANNATQQATPNQ